MSVCRAIQPSAGSTRLRGGHITRSTSCTDSVDQPSLTGASSVAFRQHVIPLCITDFVCCPVNVAAKDEQVRHDLTVYLFSQPN